MPWPQFVVSESLLQSICYWPRISRWYWTHDHMRYSSTVIVECEDMKVLLIRVDIETQTRTVISSGKRPNPSDLGS